MDRRDGKCSIHCVSAFSPPSTANPPLPLVDLDCCPCRSEVWKSRRPQVFTRIHPDSQASNSPTLLIKLHREPEWAQLHQSILGPEKSWFYLGPNKQPGYVCYGNNQTNHGMMEKFRKRSWAGSSYVIWFPCPCTCDLTLIEALALLHPSRVRNINGKLPQRGWRSVECGLLIHFFASWIPFLVHGLVDHSRCLGAQ